MRITFENLIKLCVYKYVFILFLSFLMSRSRLPSRNSVKNQKKPNTLVVESSKRYNLKGYTASRCENVVTTLGAFYFHPFSYGSYRRNAVAGRLIMALVDLATEKDGYAFFNNSTPFNLQGGIL